MPKRSSRKNQLISDSSSNATKRPGKPRSQGPKPRGKDRVLATNVRDESFASSIECMQYLQGRELAMAEMINRLIESEHALKQLQDDEISIIERKHIHLLENAAKAASQDADRTNSYAESIESIADKNRHTLDRYAKENAKMSELLVAANERAGHAAMCVIEAEKAQAATATNTATVVRNILDTARQNVKDAMYRAEMAEARAAGIEQKLTAANEKIGVFEQDLETAKKDATEASQRAEEFGGNLRDLEQRFNEIASRNLSCIDENKDLKKKLHDAEHALAVAEERTASLNTLFQEIGHDVLAVSKKIMTVTSDNDA